MEVRTGGSGRAVGRCGDGAVRGLGRRQPGGTMIGGWELTSLQEPGRIDDTGYRDRLPMRQADMVRCLIASGRADVTYDLRIVSVPRPPAPTEIRIGILAEAEEAGPVDELGALLRAGFPEATFERIADDDLGSFLEPFQVEAAAQIRRRHGREPLGTLRRGLPAAGFERDPAEEADPEQSIYHVFPFMPGDTDHGHLLRLLLQLGQPVVISVKIRPTTLSEDEQAMLEQGIGTCDDYLAALLDRGTATKVAVADQVRAFQRLHTRMLEALSDDCCEMVVEVGTIETVPHVLVDAVGSTITAPSGGVERHVVDPVDPYLMGGYEVVVSDGACLGTLQLPEDADPPGTGRIHRLFDSVEASRAFRLPDALVPEPTGLSRTGWAVPYPPRTLVTEGTLVGLQSGREWRISPEDRVRHVYVVGQTGTGKTTVLQTMILDDIRSGKGVCVVDPHGDLYRWLLARIPEERWDDVVLIDPTDREYPVGFNPLECRSELERHHLVQEMVGMIHRMVVETFGREMVGPVFHRHVRMNLLMVMSDPQRQATLLDFYNVFQHPRPHRIWDCGPDADPLLRDWVKNVLPKVDYVSTSSDGSSMGGYVSSKFQPFVFDVLIRNMIGQRRSTFDLRECMDNQKIVLVNLAKGMLAENNAYWLGMLFLSKLLVDAMSRAERPAEDRPVFHLYVDEFQSMASENFVSMLSEGRKFGLAVVMANQFVSQIENRMITAGIFGNVGTIIGFRVGVEDAEMLDRQFAPEVRAPDFVSLPNWKAYLSGLIHGAKQNPVLIDTIPPGPIEGKDATEEVVKRSRERYASTRSEAEDDIAESMDLTMESRRRECLM